MGATPWRPEGSEISHASTDWATTVDRVRCGLLQPMAARARTVRVRASRQRLRTRRLRVVPAMSRQMHGCLRTGGSGVASWAEPGTYRIAGVSSECSANNDQRELPGSAPKSRVRSLVSRWCLIGPHRTGEALRREYGLALLSAQKHSLPGAYAVHGESGNAGQDCVATPQVIS